MGMTTLTLIKQCNACAVVVGLLCEATSILLLPKVVCYMHVASSGLLAVMLLL